MGGNLRNFIQIYKGDEPAKCSAEGLPPGTYDDLSLRVCLPTKNELLPFLDQVIFSHTPKPNYSLIIHPFALEFKPSRTVVGHFREQQGTFWRRKSSPFSENWMPIIDNIFCLIWIYSRKYRWWLLRGFSIDRPINFPRKNWTTLFTTANRGWSGVTGSTPLFHKNLSRYYLCKNND